MIDMKPLVFEKFLFLSKFLHSPGEVGSVTPSSVFLAKKITGSVPWDEVNHIAELGAGTGAITQHIQSAVKKHANVLLFEKDQKMRTDLTGKFPDFLLFSDCRMLRLAMREAQIEQLDCVISGLPFFNFPQRLRDQILEQIVASLKPGGLFVAFQYSQQMKSQLAEYFEIEEIKFVLMNFPPAFVYVCRKKK
ncbi:class I SAM-dependent methyltransferase [Paenibacillus thalictri]|uniref:Methyltransferase domain-containing protein n=1 Tax=Paenibacillus thalictri TaxID=2527873 RepID=A0A4Q9DSC0_9BACL|nr:methyltransferase domain-containing protein [Paenibacillus thalictri]TBL76644.1 methyltransferase domain-containing protein [Paenibacillus thalictri]